MDLIDHELERGIDDHARVSSGSRSRIISVVPFMSANNAVTVLRSPSDRLPVSSEVIGELLFESVSWPRVGVPRHNHHKSVSNQDFQIRISRNAYCYLPFEISDRRQLDSEIVEQRLRAFRIGGIEAFGEPVVDISKPGSPLTPRYELASRNHEGFYLSPAFWRSASICWFTAASLVISL
jgi:hypothetical protein